MWLSTAPHEPPTHWYQIRCLLAAPVFVKNGLIVNGKLTLTANEKWLFWLNYINFFRQSYYALLEVEIDGVRHCSKMLDLKIPYFRYGGPVSLAIPGQNYESPSDGYLQNLDFNKTNSFGNINKGIFLSLTKG